MYLVLVQWGSFDFECFKLHKYWRNVCTERSLFWVPLLLGCCGYAALSPEFVNLSTYRVIYKHKFCDKSLYLSLHKETFYVLIILISFLPNRTQFCIQHCSNSYFYDFFKLVEFAQPQTWCSTLKHKI